MPRRKRAAKPDGRPTGGDPPVKKHPKRGRTNGGTWPESAAKSVAGCDKMCHVSGECDIYVDPESGHPYSCVLNQTNISRNNNKFFIIQVLKAKDKEEFYAWIRWGRVGYKGQTSLTRCGSSADEAVGIFEKKFLDKTKNAWSERKDFEKHPGKYDLVHTNLQDDEGEDEEPDAAVEDVDGADLEKSPVPDSKLEKSVQDLIKMICDVKTMEDAAAEMEFDTKRNPLGKISSDQIKAGYSTLAAISDLISGIVATTETRRKATELSSEFYTRIPHCFGMRTPPPILSMDGVKSKIKLLEVLGDIKLGMDLIKRTDEEGDRNPLDVLYANLDCDISCLPKHSETFEMLEQYIMSTHGKTHSTYRMTVEEIFECVKPSLPFRKEMGNRMLLFHGSRMSNWAGILSQGLRIAPKEAPVTGYMFGKGIYFADVSSKSANYCHANRTNEHGMLLLCEVALGKTDDLIHADFDAQKAMPEGTTSVKGRGKMVPDPKNVAELEDGVTVPLGPPEKTSSSDLVLTYNEYVVYDPKQVRPRFLAKIKFLF